MENGYDGGTSVGSLGGVGTKRLELYKKLGIETVGDLIRRYPRGYADFSDVVAITDARPNENAVIKVIITKKMPAAKIRQGLTLYKVLARDDTGDVTIIIYNNRYAQDALKEGGEYYLSGRITGGFARKEINSPLCLAAEEKSLLRPIYGLTEGLTSNMVITNITEALNGVNDEFYAEPLPERVLDGLISFREAIRGIHFPESEEAAANARTRLAFDELLRLRLGMALIKSRNREKTARRMSDYPMEGFYRALPFEMTGAQKRAVGEITRDMRGCFPMNRLLQGDVGSGKTAVAAAAVYWVCKNGFQTALMAPTEILARQHFKTLTEILTPLGITVCCLTGSLTPRNKRMIKDMISSGEAGVAVGTHALISETTEFLNLGLVITDEQHRFGVTQRAALAGKGNNPHKLVMSATPIPRTLSLIIYGDLDISILDEVPKGRLATETYAVTSKLRERAYNFIKKEINAGRQAYIVCPAIEESEDADMASAILYAHELAEKTFEGYRVGLLHGKMPSAEKESVMTGFKDGEIQLLVSTTVVEVGVDVPNASVMMIENADRFGLSQLHQLRGRVGRGKYKSSCILVTANDTPEVRERLKMISDTSDGFKISEYDLKMRGAGDFLGERQHGLPNLKIADIAADTALIARTGAAAEFIIADSPDLSKYPLLKREVDIMFENNSGDKMN